LLSRSEAGFCSHRWGNLLFKGDNRYVSNLPNLTDYCIFAICRTPFYTMIEVIFKIFLTDYIDFQGFITKRIQKPLLIEYSLSAFLLLSNLTDYLSLSHV
jgi:hypothetical protein